MQESTTDSLRKLVQTNVRIAEHDMLEILELFEERAFKKDKIIVSKGHIVKAYYFVVSGTLRIYFDKEDQQVTAWIAVENDFFTELESYHSGKPSKYTIIAAENTLVLTMGKEKMQYLLDKSLTWQAFVCKIWEQAFLRVVSALISYQTMTSEERYMEMLKDGTFLQRLPLKQLASFLGITQTSLSRLRRKKS